MPDAALKHLSKKAKISFGQAEHYWHVASNIVKKEYDVDENDAKYWALTMGIAKKMMGLKESLSFIEFLHEGAVNKSPKLEHLNVESAIDMLNTHCKDAIWMLKDNRPLYRGDKSGVFDELNVKSGFGVMDSSKTVRVSQNTSNFYTLILDNIQSMKDFPKRSRSFIMTNDRKYARRFDTYGEPDRLLICIPFDGVKIGVVGHEDMWDTQIPFFGKRYSIDECNDTYEDALGLSAIDWQSFINFDKALKNNETWAIDKFTWAFDENTVKRFKHSFLEEIERVYSPASTGFICRDTSTLKNYTKNSEVWVEGKCVIITVDMWNKLRLALINMEN